MSSFLFFFSFHLQAQLGHQGNQFTFQEGTYSKDNLWKVFAHDEEAYKNYEQYIYRKKMANFFGTISIVSMAGAGLSTIGLTECQDGICHGQLGSFFIFSLLAIITGTTGLIFKSTVNSKFRQAVKLFNENFSKDIGTRNVNSKYTPNTALGFGVGYTF